MKDTIMNQEKLAKLQAQVRIGGKVTARITSFPFINLIIFPGVLHDCHKRTSQDFAPGYYENEFCYITLAKQ